MFKNLDEAQKKTLIAWFVVGVCVLLCVVLITIKTVQSSSKKYDDPYVLVSDKSRYYTVANAVEKYYSFVSDKNYESVLHIFDSNFVKTNNITTDNIESYIPDMTTATLTYSSRKMCSKQVAEGVYSYLVSGYEEDMWTGTRYDQKYYKVILDGNEFRFSITPIEQSDFEGGCN